jgi:EAL domain-containing protein (putative c-di-GMP-specific phosphodiesterase class I)
VALGRGIGSTVIAEGIHTEEEVGALQAMGVDYGQGYLLARPEPGPE